MHITIPLYDHATPAEVADILAELERLGFSMPPRLDAPAAFVARVVAAVGELGDEPELDGSEYHFHGGR